RRSELERLARALATLEARDVPPASAAAKAAAILGESLGVRYGADVEGRSRDETLRLAREAGAGEETVEEARRNLESLERIAFAPATPGAASEAIGAARAFVERMARETA
ncbi:MAG TPA: hypothetical protein VL503_11615, partial [Candidatus Omnitrophota bacterium]|nr:hypothetical protein [Candidatus Omnitrophota bacterium]